MFSGSAAAIDNQCAEHLSSEMDSQGDGNTIDERNANSDSETFL